MKVETKLVHEGQHIDPSTGALTSPIHLSTTFERDADGSYASGYIYSRGGNPNRNAFEQSLASLEKGKAALAFSSGSVAMMTVLQALKPGDHVLAPEDLYFGVRVMLVEIFVPWGLEVGFVDMTDLAKVKAALTNKTQLLILETPSNPQLNVSDLKGLADLAHSVGAYLCCDNSAATPILQRPIEFGADLVVHATTKYIGGHSDILGGMLVTAEEMSYGSVYKIFKKLAEPYLLPLSAG